MGPLSGSSESSDEEAKLNSEEGINTESDFKAILARGPAKPLAEKEIQNGSFGHWPGYSEKRVVQISRMQRHPFQNLLYSMQLLHKM